MKNIVLKIEGMHCEGCSKRLEKVLNNLEGINEAIVNLNEKNANIEYLEEKISIKNIEEEIENAGFEVIK